MIAILMNLRGLDLQSAVDFVGDLCKQTIDAFIQNQRAVPSFGPALDRDVAHYVQGLQDWIVGSLHWSFMTERYFGRAGAEVKKHRIVRLLPRRDDRAQTSEVSTYSAAVLLSSGDVDTDAGVLRWPILQRPDLRARARPRARRGRTKRSRSIRCSHTSPSSLSSCSAYPPSFTFSAADTLAPSLADPRSLISRCPYMLHTNEVEGSDMDCT